MEQQPATLFVLLTTAFPYLIHSKLQHHELLTYGLSMNELENSVSNGMEKVKTVKIKGHISRRGQKLNLPNYTKNR